MRRARCAYAALYAKALPHAAIEPSRIEVVGFNLSKTWKDFCRIGLGLETVVIHRNEDGEGHTGKVLLNLPWQLLLEHGHVDTFVLRRGARLPDGFVRMDGLIKGFKGIRCYQEDGSVLRIGGRIKYLYSNGLYVICQALNGEDDLPESSRQDLIRSSTANRKRSRPSTETAFFWLIKLSSCMRPRERVPT